MVSRRSYSSCSWRSMEAFISALRSSKRWCCSTPCCSCMACIWRSRRRSNSWRTRDSSAASASRSMVSSSASMEERSSFSNASSVMSCWVAKSLAMFAFMALTRSVMACCRSRRSRRRSARNRSSCRKRARVPNASSNEEVSADVNWERSDARVTRSVAS